MRSPYRWAPCLLTALLVAYLTTPSVLAQGGRRAPRPADPFDGIAQEMFGAQIEEAVSAAVNARIAGREAAAAISQRVSAARRAFWSQYPDGPKRAEAERSFGAALMEKDLMLALVYSGALACPSAPGRMGLVLSPRSIDGGIPKGAENSFCIWVERGDSIKMGDKAAATAWLKSPEYAAYKLDRDWAEYARAGKVTASPPPPSSPRQPNQLSPEAQELQQTLMRACEEWAASEARKPRTAMYTEIRQKYCACLPTSVAPADRDALVSDFRRAFDRLFPNSSCRYPQPGPSEGSSSTVAPSSTNENAPAAVPPTAGAPTAAWLGKPRKIKHVNPVYPPQAAAAGIRGFVVIEITINTDGTVSDARVIRSIPMLDQAALEAVRQWAFAAGEIQAPVRLTVTVTF